ncbi:MAG: hypothetical protein LBL36_04120 [Clostridiales Family XIII bacterium]|jgi:hypothetical protein|nr:hypothetical protein [Clostridiales Family XIII bacterium]
MQLSIQNRTIKSALVIALTAALILTSVFVSAGRSGGADAYAGSETALGAVTPLDYPWSARAATGDYFADVYDGIGAGSVFENVTTDRLLDILSGANTPAGSSYYIVFGGPEHTASQKILAKIGELAAAAGITKIYHFDPYVDGYQLDATQKNGVADVTGGTSVNFGGNAKVSDVWTLITDLLPASAIENGGALQDYDGKDLLLLSVQVSNRKDVNAGKSILASYKLTEAAAATGGFTAASQAAGISAVFTAGGTSAERSEWSFFKRLYDGSATRTETANASAPTADRYGEVVTIFSQSDFPDGAGFVLDSIDLKELYNLLNSPGEVPILFAGQGCHNTQAIIGAVAERAKELNVPKVYVVDFALDSNVKFGTGDAVDTVLGNSATGGLWIRQGTGGGFSSPLGTEAPYRYGYTYLYGYLAAYFGDNWITENESKKTANVPYFIDAVLGGTQTKSAFKDLGSDHTPRYINDETFNPVTDVANAKRLQVPTIIRYNKDAADPVVGHWLHENDNTVITTDNPDTYTEYMLELAWVNAIPTAQADEGRSTGRDGLTKVEFAAEAVAALDNVLKADTEVVHTFTAAPTPEIGGVTATVGGTLTAYEGDWSHDPAFSYTWYADGNLIAGAADDTYVTKAADAGKRITVAVTGTRAGYEAVTKLSAPTEPIGGSAVKTGWQRIGGTWYYLGADGAKKTGWVYDRDYAAWYYLAPNGGALKTGWVSDGGRWYYLLGNGKLVTGKWFHDTDGRWYYLSGNGAMVTGTYKIGAKTYSFKKNGAWIG